MRQPGALEQKPFAMNALMVLLILCGHCAAQAAEGEVVQIGPDKKIIEWGWDEPNPAFMRANAERMDGYGFDGVIFHAEPLHNNGKRSNFAWTCWGRMRFEYAQFADTVADLQAANAKFKRMTENFLRFNVCPGDVDWFDDAAFAVVAGNAELAGRVAQEGGCKGLMFDIEMYNNKLFSYLDLKQKADRPFAEYEAKVRQRGQELMRAFNRFYPDITVLLTYGYGITGVGGDCSKKPYGLLKNLLDGMFDAADPKAVIVDAYEGAYGFRTDREFARARDSVLKDIVQHTGNPEEYKAHARVGFGVWMDNRSNAMGWHVDDFEQNYFLPQEFEYTLFCGLRNTDRYVWVYTERTRWWTNDKLPPAYLEALRRARAPRAIDDARFEGRKVKGWTGPSPKAASQPGYSDDETFGDLKAKYDFVADLPKTWKFRTDPKKEGEKASWFKPGLDLSGWRDMQIGKFWDEQGVTHLGDAWYRLDWTAPAGPAPEKAKLFLWFGAVDETATVWVNGIKAGAHDEPPDFGWDKRFAIDVTGKLKPGELNTVAVKVGNSSLAGGIWKSVKLAVER